MKFIMKLIKALIIPAVAALLLLILYAGGYVVVPDNIDFGGSGTSKGWSAVATGIGASDSGAVRIDLAIRNETGDWRAMQAIAGKSAEWTTEVAVLGDVKGLYIMLSVESRKQRLFKNYCIDVADK
jgi:hypothetical protein